MDSFPIIEMLMEEVAFTNFQRKLSKVGANLKYANGKLTAIPSFLIELAILYIFQELIKSRSKEKSQVCETIRKNSFIKKCALDAI